MYHVSAIHGSHITMHGSNMVHACTCVSTMYLDYAKFELTNHIAYRVENKSLISTPRKLISTAGKLIFQVHEYT